MLICVRGSGSNPRPAVTVQRSARLMTRGLSKFTSQPRRSASPHYSLFAKIAALGAVLMLCSGQTTPPQREPLLGAP